MKKVLLLSFLFGFLACNQPKEKELIAEASCGQCQFNLKTQKGCDLAVRINNEVYFVDGAHIDDYGDAHDKEIGFCNVIRKVKIKGNIENNKYKVSSFKIIE